VTPGSPAERAGLQPGDRLLAVNGMVPRDIIDVRFDGSGPSVELDVERAGMRVVLYSEKGPDEDLGIEFDSPAFDHMKTCNNACDFCFIRGLPSGLRRSLYVKDDDFRYSFLYGNFTTLTNLSDAEWRRLIFQRLSPLHVSVHATDPELRRDLLGNAHAPPILEQLDELGAHGIHVHAQIVLMPGRNDGSALARTLEDLAARHPAVESAAVVPVGLTVHSRPTRARPLDPADANAAIQLVERRQAPCRRAFGVGFAYAADELYLLAGRKLPPARAYDGYPQLQNGVGLVQLFRESWKRAVRRRPTRAAAPHSVAWATGRLMAPIMAELARDLRAEGLALEVVAVDNSLFGGQVSVAGLMPGVDVVAALSGRNHDRVVLPRAMFDVAGRLTIDGWTAERIADALEAEVLVASSAEDLIEQTLGVRNGPFAARDRVACAAS